MRGEGSPRIFFSSQNLHRPEHSVFEQALINGQRPKDQANQHIIRQRPQAEQFNAQENRTDRAVCGTAEQAHQAQHAAHHATKGCADAEGGDNLSPFNPATKVMAVKISFKAKSNQFTWPSTAVITMGIPDPL